MSAGGKIEGEDLDEERFRRVTIPLCYDVMVPITAKLMKKLKHVKEIEDELVVQRIEFQMRMKKVERRRKTVNQKEALLWNSLKDFEQFFEERERKKIYCESKYAEEEQEVEKVDKELESLIKVKRELTVKRDILVKCIEKYEPAYKFLQAVADEAVVFEDVGDIIAFYDTLVTVNRQLRDVEKATLNDIDSLSQKLTEYKNEMQNKLLALSNRACELQQECEASHDYLLSKEAHYEEAEESNTRTARSVGQVFMAINSMYMTMCEFEGFPGGEKNPLNQMQKVHEFIQDWSEIAAEAIVMQKEDDDDDE